MGGIAQTVLVKEVVYTFTIGTGADGIGHVMLVSTEELGQTGAIQIGIGVDVAWTVHEIADTAEKLLISCQVLLGFSF